MSSIEAMIQLLQQSGYKTNVVVDATSGFKHITANPIMLTVQY